MCFQSSCFAAEQVLEPMSEQLSNDALVPVEGQISIKFAQLSEMVKADDIVKVKELANEVIILVGDRNKKCKLLK